MKILLLLSASATFLVAIATQEEPSFSDVVRSLKFDPKGIRMLGRDGVLRRFNAARDTVVDSVQLSASHITEFTKSYPPEAQELWAGVDGRAVTNEAQLWAVPDDVLPLEPSAMMSKPNDEGSLLTVAVQECRRYACVGPDECQAEYNCAECDIFYECPGGPFGCSRYKRCDDTLPR